MGEEGPIGKIVSKNHARLCKSTETGKAVHADAEDFRHRIWFPLSERNVGCADAERREVFYNRYPVSCCD